MSGADQHETGDLTREAIAAREASAAQATGQGGPVLIDGVAADAPDILKKIVRARQRHIVDSSQTLVTVPPAEEVLPCLTAADNPFLEALSRHHREQGRAVIAEVKLGSPRLGSLVDRIDPEAQAEIYAAHGAAALSVVVEPEFFHGDYEVLTRCRQASGLPTIAKDFVVNGVQLLWAKRYGADAVLLIAALYDAERLRELANEARNLGLVPLIETHSPEDVAKLGGPQAEWELVGVNNRDLRTFEVDLQHSMDLLPSLPQSALKVAESGLKSGAEVRRLAEAGFHAFLIGESLLLADDPAATLRGFLA
jgi:indole-3-glycerol phosphate synthase